MEKNITIANSQSTAMTIIEIVTNLVSIICRPVALLSLYYSHCLGREITVKQTWCLLNAQAAFFLTAFPVGATFYMRIVCGMWLLHALRLCKKNL